MPDIVFIVACAVLAVACIALFIWCIVLSRRISRLSVALMDTSQLAESALAYARRLRETQDRLGKAMKQAQAGMVDADPSMTGAQGAQHAMERAQARQMQNSQAMYASNAMAQAPVDGNQAQARLAAGAAPGPGYDGGGYVRNQAPATAQPRRREPRALQSKNPTTQAQQPALNGPYQGQSRNAGLEAKPARPDNNLKVITQSDTSEFLATYSADGETVEEAASHAGKRHSKPVIPFGENKDVVEKRESYAENAADMEFSPDSIDFSRVQGYEMQKALQMANQQNHVMEAAKHARNARAAANRARNNEAREMRSRMRAEERAHMRALRDEGVRRSRRTSREPEPQPMPDAGMPNTRNNPPMNAQQRPMSLRGQARSRSIARQEERMRREANDIRSRHEGAQGY